MITLLLVAALAWPPQATALGGAGAGDGGGDGRVQMGVLVRPDTVTVGEHFVVTVRVRAPLGSEIAFPTGPDSGLTVEAVDPRDIQKSQDTSAVERTAVYRLVAWDTGALTAHLGEVVVSTNGVDRRIAITRDTVHVQSVLPADSTLRVPKPAREILVAGRPWWHWLLLALAAIALMGLLVWWWRRRRGGSVMNPEEDAYQTAVREFERITALGLTEAGESGRHVALNVDVMRDYLAARLSEAPRSLTSTELLHAASSRAEVDIPRLASLVAESDLIKFARERVSPQRARELGLEARALVDGVEAAVEAERERAAARAEAGRAA
ncbi:MAG TPA: hypothetical protein VIP79_05740 [Gemmatimonadaceae bacterium]